MTLNNTHPLGKQARDKITGFEGIVVARVQYLTGCDQLGLAPPAKDGDVKPAQYFDEARVEIIGDGVAAASVRGQVNGGPNRDSPR